MTQFSWFKMTMMGRWHTGHQVQRLSLLNGLNGFQNLTIKENVEN